MASYSQFPLTFLKSSADIARIWLMRLEVGRIYKAHAAPVGSP
jgi:hypothetical protein